MESNINNSSSTSKYGMSMFASAPPVPIVHPVPNPHFVTTTITHPISTQSTVAAQSPLTTELLVKAEAEVVTTEMDIPVPTCLMTSAMQDTTYVVAADAMSTHGAQPLFVVGDGAATKLASTSHPIFFSGNVSSVSQSGHGQPAFAPHLYVSSSSSAPLSAQPVITLSDGTLATPAQIQALATAAANAAVASVCQMPTQAQLQSAAYVLSGAVMPPALASIAPPPTYSAGPSETTHADVKPVPTGPPYVCVDCGKAFNQKRNLREHIRMHTQSTPYTCTDCGKTFRQKRNLKDHGSVHTGERPHSCTHCGKAFRLRRDLKDHMTVHTGERPHHCSVCQKAFRQRRDLKDHESVHTGVRPHPCASCGKAFRQRRDLKDHETVHTGEKPHRCKACGKSFRQKRSLREHERTHSGEKPYICATCGKAYRIRRDLNEHTKAHPDHVELVRAPHLPPPVTKLYHVL